MRLRLQDCENECRAVAKFDHHLAHLCSKRVAPKTHNRLRAEPQSFIGHAGNIEGAFFTNDGHLVTVSDDSSILIWKFHGGETDVVDLHPAFELPSSTSMMQTSAVEEEKETSAAIDGIDLSEEVVSALAEALRAANSS